MTEILGIADLVVITALLTVASVAAYIGNARMWFFALLGVMVALAFLGGIQALGRGSFAFLIVASLLFGLICATSVPLAFLGRFIRNRQGQQRQLH